MCVCFAIFVTYSGRERNNYPANIYLFKVKNRNTRKRCEVRSKLTIKTPDRLHWRRPDVFIVNFEHILHLFLMFIFLILNKLMINLKEKKTEKKENKKTRTQIINIWPYLVVFSVSTNQRKVNTPLPWFSFLIGIKKLLLILLMVIFNFSLLVISLLLSILLLCWVPSPDSTIRLV